MIKDIFMYLLTFSGIAVLGYVRIQGANRVKKTHANNEWSPQEKKLLYIAFGLIISGLALALFVK